MTDNTVSIPFNWIVYRPDQRAYRQNSVEFVPALPNDPLKVVVQLPVKHEYIANSDDIIKAQLENDAVPNPILTIQGMKCIQDQFDVVLKDDGKSEDDGNWKDDEDWSDVKSDSKVSEETKDDEAWEEAETESAESTSWDEESEEWKE